MDVAKSNGRMATGRVWFEGPSHLTDLTMETSGLCGNWFGPSGIDPAQAKEREAEPIG